MKVTGTYLTSGEGYVTNTCTFSAGPQNSIQLNFCFAPFSTAYGPGYKPISPVQLNSTIQFEM